MFYKLRLTILLIGFSPVYMSFAQSKAEWTPYIISSTLDTAHLPLLTAKEKALQMKNEADEKRFKKELEKADRKKITPGIKVMEDSIDAHTSYIKRISDSIAQAEGWDNRGSINIIGEASKDSINIAGLKIPSEAELAKFMDSNLAILTITTDKGNNITGIVNYKTIADSYYYHDTLFVSAEIGFMAYSGISVQIADGFFKVMFGSNADDEKIYKQSLSDTSFTDHVAVNSIRQKLILVNPPLQTKRSTVCGYVEADFEPFYEKDQKSGKPIIQYCHAKLYFKCIQ